MDFFRNFNNYKPKDFKGKTEKDILAMKSNKVPDDFFSPEYATKYANEFAEAGLMEEQLNAIQLLSDLKDKSIILKKCYSKPGKHSLVPGHVKRTSPVVIAKAPQAQAPQQLHQMPQQATEAVEVIEEGTQTGGRKRKSRRRSKGTKRSRGTKRMRGGGTKRMRGTKRSSGTKRSRRSNRMRSRKHRGGTLVMTTGN